jgi:hypothetical protein
MTIKIESIDEVPGYAAQVWGGWVWIDGRGFEQRWSKETTREKCEDTVLNVVRRIGVEAAFAD